MSLGDMEPRQKMINLMYLVLLCMLAMNVSKEILQSFLIINEGLERTTENFESKILMQNLAVKWLLILRK